MSRVPNCCLPVLLAGLLAGASFADEEPASALSARRMTDAATAFVALLDDGQRHKAMLPLESGGRTVWSNLPVFFVPPNGIYVSELDDAQKAAMHDLLRASLSSQGYAKMAGIMRLDDILRDLTAEQLKTNPDMRKDPLWHALGATYTSGNYTVAIFGDPGSANWGWKLDGHHLGANFTVSGDRVGFTPTFLGSNPMRVPAGPYAGWMALPQEGDRGIELMRSLTKEQREQATVSAELPADIFEGPGLRGSLDEHEGVRAAGLTVSQMRLLRALVREYVANLDFDAADAQLRLIDESGWEEFWFSWRGPVDPAGRFYYRVHGPRLLIEYNRQDANHDHSIVRDPANDYGEDWLQRHYREYHPTISEVMESGRKRAEQEFGEALRQ
jgi:hypothetical protein